MRPALRQTNPKTVSQPYGQTELCPVLALAAWLEAIGTTSGPVFRRTWLSEKAQLGELPPLYPYRHPGEHFLGRRRYR